MKKLNLRLFDTTYTVTVYKDSHVTSATPSPASGATETSVTLTVTPATGYEVDEIEVLAGGVTLEEGETPGTYEFDIGEANVVLNVKSKKNNLYKVTQDCWINVNGTRKMLYRNTKLVIGKGGSVTDLEVSPTEITLDEGVKSLIDQEIIVKI